MILQEPQAPALERGALGFVRKGALSADELQRAVREVARAGDRP